MKQIYKYQTLFNNVTQNDLTKCNENFSVLLHKCLFPIFQVECGFYL